MELSADLGPVYRFPSQLQQHRYSTKNSMETLGASIWCVLYTAQICTDEFLSAKHGWTLVPFCPTFRRGTDCSECPTFRRGTYCSRRSLSSHYCPKVSDSLSSCHVELTARDRLGCLAITFRHLSQSIISKSNDPYGSCPARTRLTAPYTA